MAEYLTDVSLTMGIYDAVVQGEWNWLLLSYAPQQGPTDKLSLVGHGSKGLEELTQNINDIEEVHIALYRDDAEEEDPRFLLINYIPPSVSGVRRARTLVHSRRVGALFRKHHAKLTVEHISNLTSATVHQALQSETFETPRAEPLGRASSQPPIQHKQMPSALKSHTMRRSTSENSAPVIPPAVHSPRSGSMFSGFLRRKKKPEEFDENQNQFESPPPIPPKDFKPSLSRATPSPPFHDYNHHHHQSSPSQETHHYHSHQVDQDVHHSIQPTVDHHYVMPTRIPAPNASMPIPISSRRRERANSYSEFAVISHTTGSDEVVLEPYEPPTRMAPSKSLPHRGKWTLGDSSLLDPAQRALRRLEAQRQKEIEDEIAYQEELDRQARREQEKIDMERLEREEEARRRRSLDQELRRVKEARQKREQQEREDEERRHREREEKKRLDREKRLEEHRKLELWRAEQARLAEESAKLAAVAKRREDAEREKKLKVAEAKVKRTVKTEASLTGWVTLQTQESLFWKRRYYKFVGNTIYFYRSAKDTEHAMETIELRGKLRGLREWNEGYEELEAIPFSFAIEFKDEREAWSMFADSEEEKYKVLGLLHHAAGL